MSLQIHTIRKIVMLVKLVKIVDLTQNIVAIAEVQSQGNYYSGSVNVDRMPQPLLSQFEEYESLINDQVFSLLDQIEEKIDVNSFAVIFDENTKCYIEDLQILPSSRMISFKVLDPVL
jgi:hypothetical protein